MIGLLFTHANAPSDLVPFRRQYSADFILSAARAQWNRDECIYK